MTVYQDPLVIRDDCGLYCPQGDFHIDPWKPVKRAIITHAHSDHARVGSKSYLTALPGKHVLQSRLGAKSIIETMPYGETRLINGVKLSLHSAGHVLGSAQIRLEYRGHVWVVSGDYKTRADATCDPFELLSCDCFISESTFALPVYRWQDPSTVAEELNLWWSKNKEEGKVSFVFAYSFGKAQRLLSLLQPEIGTIYVHPSIEEINQAYLESGVRLPEVSGLPDLTNASPRLSASLFAGAMVLAPPSSFASEFLCRLPNCRSAFVSGWMRLKAERKRHLNLSRGFVLSDHADWDELISVISATGAEKIIVTHGFVKELVRYLKEKGRAASVLRTKFTGESDLSVKENWEDAP